MDKLISVLIVDNHAVVREGLIKIVSGLNNIRHYDEAKNGQEALDKLALDHFDIVFLDIEMDVMDGMEAVPLIKEKHKNTKIIMFSAYKDNRQVLEFIKMRVDGYILKTADKHEIIKAINHLLLDSRYFAPEVFDIWNDYMNNPEVLPSGKDKLKLGKREIEIIKLTYEGLKVKEIADKMCISPNTVSTHRHNIMKRFGMKNMTSLIKYAIDNHILIL